MNSSVNAMLPSGGFFDNWLMLFEQVSFSALLRQVDNDWQQYPSFYFESHFCHECRVKGKESDAVQNLLILWQVPPYGLADIGIGISIGVSVLGAAW